MAFLKGDKVIDVVYGEGVVVCVDSNRLYPIVTEIGKSATVRRYAPDGRHNVYDEYPSLFHREGYRPPVSKEPERRQALPVDAKILVRDSETQSWRRRRFARWNEQGGVYCFPSGRDSWTANSSIPPVLWHHWKLPE